MYEFVSIYIFFWFIKIDPIVSTPNKISIPLGIWNLGFVNGFSFVNQEISIFSPGILGVTWSKTTASIVAPKLFKGELIYTWTWLFISEIFLDTPFTKPFTCLTFKPNFFRSEFVLKLPCEQLWSASTDVSTIIPPLLGLLPPIFALCLKLLFKDTFVFDFEMFSSWWSVCCVFLYFIQFCALHEQLICPVLKHFMHNLFYTYNFISYCDILF